MQNPAQRVIQKCGGFQAVAAMLGVDVSRVHRWTYPKVRGGTDGKIPHAHQDRLLRLARGQGIKLRPADFFVTASAPQPSPADQPATGATAAGEAA